MLNGAFVFTADLVRNIQPHVLDMRVDFIRASSYGSASASDGAVKVNQIGDQDRWQGWHVLLVRPRSRGRRSGAPLFANGGTAPAAVWRACCASASPADKALAMPGRG